MLIGTLLYTTLIQKLLYTAAIEKLYIIRNILYKNSYAKTVILILYNLIKKT